MSKKNSQIKKTTTTNVQTLSGFEYNKSDKEVEQLINKLYNK